MINKIFVKKNNELQILIGTWQTT